MSPSTNGTVLTAIEQMPQGVPTPIGSERRKAFSPGLDADMLAAAAR